MRVHTLEESILLADTVAWVELISVTQTVKTWTYSYSLDTPYLPAFEFRFKVLEYLMGSGSNEITVLVLDTQNPQATEAEARERVTGLATWRPSQWDDRQAVVFLVDESDYIRPPLRKMSTGWGS